MSIFSWFNKMLGIDNSTNNINLPSEFQVPTEHINNGMHNFENNDFIDPFSRNNPFEESMNIFHTSLQDMLEQFELQFPSDIENNNNSNVFIVPFKEDDDFINQSSNAVEYNKIPKQNFTAKNYFLNSRQASKTLNRTPVRVTMSPGINFGQSSSRTYISGKWNGRTIEKETCTKQLQGGITEKVIVMKDGNQKCVTTITENSQTGEQNSNKQLFNLDESQLNEFENRFSKFR